MTGAHPVRVGLVGAGPWAAGFHAPMLAASPDVELVGIWARRPEAAASLAARHATEAVDDFASLVEASEAVAFAVPPDVQADLAVRAAAAGRHLLLEKPLALDLGAAEALARAVQAAGVVSQLVLTSRYTPAVRRFLEEAGATRPLGARCAAVSGGLVGGPFATPWRLEHGSLLDVGPHVLDLLDAAVGPIGQVAAEGDPRTFVVLTCRHQSGVVSQAALSQVARTSREVWSCEVYGAAGEAVFDAGALDMEAQWAAARSTVPSELAGAVRSGVPHPLDVVRGLHLQRLISQAQACLA